MRRVGANSAEGGHGQGLSPRDAPPLRTAVRGLRALKNHVDASMSFHDDDDLVRDLHVDIATKSAGLTLFDASE